MILRTYMMIFRQKYNCYHYIIHYSYACKTYIFEFDWYWHVASFSFHNLQNNNNIKDNNNNNNNNHHNNNIGYYHRYPRSRIKLISTNNSTESTGTAAVGHVNRSDVIKAKLQLTQSLDENDENEENEENINDTFSDFAAAATVISKSNIVDNNECVQTHTSGFGNNIQDYNAR